MAQTAERTANLIAYTVSEDHQRPDLEACLEISDRVNSLKTECIETVMTIIKCLGKPSPKIVLNTIQLLETLCKNCNMRFLYELNNKKLVEALMKTLALRRERTKKPKKAKPVDKLTLQVEDKILYLIQLWADTFMMHQEEFKNIHEAYRTLRKEGVKFPERDPNERFMMNFQGTISPVFLAMDENYIVPSNNQGGPVPEPKKETYQGSKYNVKEPEYQHEVETNSRAPPAQMNTLYNEDEEYDYSVYDGIEITKDEMKIVEESISILKEIELNATKPGDMKSEIANEILGDLVHVNKRIRRIILTDKFSSTIQRNDAMRLNDLINDCLSSYRQRYNIIKDNYNKGITTEPVVKQPQPEVGGFLDDDDHQKAENLNKQVDNLKIEESHDDKKPGYTGVRKLAPPKGWKGPPQKTDIDLLDLLDSEVPQTNNVADSKEETKQNTPTPQNNETPKNYMDDLLSLDIGGGSHQNQHQNVSHNNNNGGFNFGHAQPVNPNLNFMGSMSPSYQVNNNQQMGMGMGLNQFASAPGFQNFNNLNQPNPSTFASVPNAFGNNNQNTANQNQGGFDFDFGQAPSNQNSQAKPQESQQTQAKSPFDDDDFFSDMANRTK